MPTQEELQAAAEAFNQPAQPRREDLKGDLDNIMRQIEELEKDKEKGLERALSINKDLAQADGDSGTTEAAAQAQSPHPLGLSGETAALPSSLPASPSPAPPNLPKAPEWLHSIAEVISKESRHYGVLFKLGDIKSGKAHGYILKERGVPEFVTVPADAILLHGKARVKSKGCCSPQWMSENKE